MAPLTRLDLLRVFGRSLWLQASWSFEGMQSLGFAYAMDPAITRLHGEEEGRRSVRERHLEFFNTHPYLAAAILGCAVRLEEEGGEGAAEEVSRAKNALMGPYGAVGDGFYWGSLKPLLLVLAVLAAMLGGFWAPWVFVTLYTSVNLLGRAWLFVEGYRRGMGVVDFVNRLRLLRAARHLKAACAVALGVLVVAAVATGAGAGAAGSFSLFAAAGWGLVLALSWVLAAGLNPAWIVYLLVAASAGITVLS